MMLKKRMLLWQLGSWYLTSVAVLFSAEKRDDDWSLVTHFEHPEGRELSSEIRPSSPPGRMQKNKASGHPIVDGAAHLA